MNKKDKLLETTMLALQGKLYEENEKENEIKIHFIDDYTYDNKDIAIQDFENRAGDLQSDGLEQLSQLAYSVVDKLNDGQTNIVIDDNEIDEANRIDGSDDTADIDDNVSDNGLYYDEDIDGNRILNNYYDNYDLYGIGNAYEPEEYLGKKFKKSVRVDGDEPIYESIDKFPDFSDILKEINSGNLVTLNSDYVIGKSADVISTYAQYTYEKDDAYVNYYNFNSKIKKQLSGIRNGHKPYKDDIMYVGIDSTDTVVYGNGAKTAFENIYNNLIDSDNFRLSIFYL